MMGPWSDTAAALALRSRVLAWLETLRADGGGGRYRLNAGVTPTVFASCFAVFLRRLFDDLPPEGSAERQAWLEDIRQFQDPDTGLFSDPGNRARTPDSLHDARHLDWQLTTFCLSAIDGLGGAPAHPLRFVDDWTPDRTRAHLAALDWHNPWNSGNKAMFLGIVLSCHAQAGSNGARAALDAWFEWHDRHQNRVGFWGAGPGARFVDGMGGAYHQFLIYRFWNRPIARIDRIVDRVLLLQQPDGTYSPWPSGATCYELDAADILVHAYHTLDYRRRDIAAALGRIQTAVLSMQNPDGGFCWGRRRPWSPTGWMRLMGAFAQHRSLFYLYYTARAGLAIQLRRRPTLRTGWADAPRLWEESSIFDTWFRCLTLAEISTVLLDSPFAARWQYLSVPGLGWFEPVADSGASAVTPRHLAGEARGR
jgi:hypothetical protein